jgi:hypothetical protein
MTVQPDEQITFRILDKRNGIPDLPPEAEEDFPLPAWYRAVRDIPLQELGVEDLSRANRKQIYPDHSEVFGKKAYGARPSEP